MDAVRRGESTREAICITEHKILLNKFSLAIERSRFAAVKHKLFRRFEQRIKNS